MSAPKATPKFTGLLARRDAMVATIEARAEQAHARINAVETAAVDGIDKFEKTFALIDAQTSEIEDQANQLTNGGPPLERSGG